MESKQLEQVEPGRYRLLSRAGYRTGTLDMTHHGYAFLVSEDESDDVFIARNNLKTAWTGIWSKFLFIPNEKTHPGLKEKLWRSWKEHGILLWVRWRYRRNYAFLLPDSRKMPFDIFLPLENLKGVEHGQKAIARIIDWPEKIKNPFGEIVDILGYPGENDTEMHSILAEFELPIKFSAEVEAAAEKIPDKIISRKRLRKGGISGTPPLLPLIRPMPRILMMPFPCVRWKGGLWEVGVHIADVSHYVKTKTILDNEAYDTGNLGIPGRPGGAHVA